MIMSNVAIVIALGTQSFPARTIAFPEQQESLGHGTVFFMAQRTLLGEDSSSPNNAIRSNSSAHLLSLVDPPVPTSTISQLPPYLDDGVNSVDLP